MSGRRRIFAWGIAAAGAYLLAALSLTGKLPGRLLLDGLAPPGPYRWVNPPSEFEQGNEQPLEGSDGIPFTDGVSEPVSASTGDSQATISIPQGAFAPREGDEIVQIRMVPLDPLGIATHPRDLEFDGNAYEITANYEPSGETAEPQLDVTVIVRYPVHATRLLEWTGSEWSSLKTVRIPAALQIFGRSRELGTFVAAGPVRQQPIFKWLAYASAGAALLGIVAGLIARMRIRRRQSVDSR